MVFLYPNVVRCWALDGMVSIYRVSLCLLICTLSLFNTVKLLFTPNWIFWVTLFAKCLNVHCKMSHALDVWNARNETWRKLLCFRIGGCSLYLWAKTNMSQPLRLMLRTKLIQGITLETLFSLCELQLHFQNFNVSLPWFVVGLLCMFSHIAI